MVLWVQKLSWIVLVVQRKTIKTNYCDFNLWFVPAKSVHPEFPEFYKLFAESILLAIELDFKVNFKY